MSSFNYRLTSRKKHEIATNLINAMSNSEPLTSDSGTFVSNWCLTGPNEKRKAFYDVWDEVLLNYKPKTFPTIYRSCRRFNDNKIVSFTGNIASASLFAFSKACSSKTVKLAICDTQCFEFFFEIEKNGHYTHSFYPLGKLLAQEMQLPKSVLSRNFLAEYVSEDEYVLRFPLDYTYHFKWLL